MPKNFLLSMVAVLALAACATKPDSSSNAAANTAADLPATWAAQGQAVQPDAAWWRSFGDAELNSLVEEALKRNTDIARALARVAQARAQVGIANADRSPQLGLQAEAARVRLSRAAGAVPAGVSATQSQFGLGLQAAYEVDLWSRYATAAQAARADLAAAQADRAAVQVTVAADVARLYFALGALDARTAIQRRALERQGESLRLQTRREQAGVISGYELRQLDAEIAALQAELPSLTQQREQLQTALALLAWRGAREVMDVAITPGTASVPAEIVVPAGLPSELLLRRPDLVRAQHRLAAADARVEVARTAAYPSIALTASLGSASSKLSDLFSGPAFVWSVGAAVAQTLFDGGRREAQTDAARAQRQLALAEWQASLAQAFGDVRDALQAQTGTRASAQAQRERIAALERVLGLARSRLRNGVASQLEVLDAERSLLTAQSALVIAEQGQRTALVDLYKSLGGGWQPQDEAQALRK